MFSPSIDECDAPIEISGIPDLLAGARRIGEHQRHALQPLREGGSKVLGRAQPVRVLQVRGRQDFKKDVTRYYVLRCDRYRYRGAGSDAAAQCGGKH